jgi:hypothetical protein
LHVLRIARRRDFEVPIAQGDLLYGSAANVLSALAKDTNSTRALCNTGTSNNPAWCQIALTTGVTGVLPLANGGTNANLTASNGGIFYSTASAAAVAEAPISALPPTAETPVTATTVTATAVPATAVPATPVSVSVEAD